MGLGGGCLLLKPPASALANATNLINFYVLLCLPTVFMVVSIGAAWLFVSALQYFKAELRRAYRVIVVGVALLGLMHLQLSVLAYVSTMGAVGFGMAPWVSYTCRLIY